MFIAIVALLIGGIIYFFYTENNVFHLHMADVDIRSNLSQVRNDTEMYYYEEGGESYSNYRRSEGWEEVSGIIPECSKERLREEFSELSEDFEEYQLKIRGEKYIAWAPLCRKETVFCVDSSGNSIEMGLDEVEDAIKDLKCAN